jgi:hypothetical protein
VSIDFNHTLVHAKDTWAAAREVSGVLCPLASLLARQR